MGGDLNTYEMVLVLGIASVLAVGQVLLAAGQAILEDAFANQRVANSVNRLVAVLFHLGALGVVALISTVDIPVTGAVRLVVTKVGIVLLIVGVAHALLLMLLTSIRARSRADDVDDIIFQLETARRQIMTNPPTVQAVHRGGSSPPR